MTSFTRKEFCFVGPHRNTKAYRVVLYDRMTLYISYETVIAISAPGACYRRENNWGPTTGRHFTEMGVDKFHVITDAEEFTRIVNEELMETVLSMTGSSELQQELASRALTRMTA